MIDNLTRSIGLLAFGGIIISWVAYHHEKVDYNNLKYFEGKIIGYQEYKLRKSNKKRIEFKLDATFKQLIVEKVETFYKEEFERNGGKVGETVKIGVSPKDDGLLSLAVRQIVYKDKFYINTLQQAKLEEEGENFLLLLGGILIIIGLYTSIQRTKGKGLLW